MLFHTFTFQTHNKTRNNNICKARRDRPQQYSVSGAHSQSRCGSVRVRVRVCVCVCVGVCVAPHV